MTYQRLPPYEHKLECGCVVLIYMMKTHSYSSGSFWCDAHQDFRYSQWCDERHKEALEQCLAIRGYFNAEIQ